MPYTGGIKTEGVSGCGNVSVRPQPHVGMTVVVLGMLVSHASTRFVCVWLGGTGQGHALPPP